MPALKVYKIGVKFSMTDDAPPPAQRQESGEIKTHGPKASLSDRDKRMIRVLQQDLPLVPEPFNQWAIQANVSLDHLLDAAKAYICKGMMRRFSAVLRHREAGFGANAMGAWVVPPEQHDEFGHSAAMFGAVSHCYLRPAYPPDWPYSIFTMVHGREKSQCEAVLDAISEKTGIRDYAALYSTKEYKKIRVKYFAGDIEQWETDALLAGCEATMTA
jgi:DNA-binding Lrp family transcriptional regulator